MPAMTWRTLGELGCSAATRAKSHAHRATRWRSAGRSPGCGPAWLVAGCARHRHRAACSRAGSATGRRDPRFAGRRPARPPASRRAGVPRCVGVGGGDHAPVAAPTARSVSVSWLAQIDHIGVVGAEPGVEALEAGRADRPAGRGVAPPRARWRPPPMRRPGRARRLAGRPAAARSAPAVHQPFVQGAAGFRRPARHACPG